MKYVYYYDICAILVLAILLANLLSRRNVERFRNNILLMLISVGMLSSISDLSAAILQDSGMKNVAARTALFCLVTIYFLCHNLIFPFFLAYIHASLDIWYLVEQKVTRKVIWYGGIIIYILMLATNPITGYIFTISSDMEYTRGNYRWIFHLITIVYALWGVFTVLYFRKIVSKRKIIVLLSAIPVVTTASVLQGLFGNYLMENFAFSTIALMYVIVVHQSENPIDPASGSMKYTRGLMRVRNAFNIGKPFTTILIDVTNSNSIQLYIGDERFSRYLNMQSQKLNEILESLDYSGATYYIENGAFAVFADDTDKEKAMQFAREMEIYYNGIHKVDSLEIFPEAAICVVSCPEDVDNVETLITLAMTFDTSLNIRRGVVKYADYCNDRRFNISNNISTIIDDAIKNKNFELDYQPIFSQGKNGFVGAEAIIKLKSEEYGYISSDLFIPAAENSIQIAEIGKFIILEVIDFISRNNMEDLGLDYIQLPLFASSRIEVNLDEKVKANLDAKGVNPKYICMKITESAIDNNPSNVVQNVTKLNAMGIRFALDRYGSGYSNVRRVVSLPFEQIKLDDSFVGDIKNPVIWQMLQDSVAMFREMGKKVLVKGVEHDRTARLFAGIGVDLIQGCDFYEHFECCSPMTEENFVDYLRTRQIR